MKKIALTFLCFVLLFPLSGHTEEPRDPELKPGDVMVPVALRQACRNRNGNCVFCSAEMMAVTAGYEELRGLFQSALHSGWHGASLYNVEATLRDAHIRFVSQHNNRDTKILYDAIREGSPFYYEIPGHAMIGVGIDQDTVRVVDNNGPPVVRVWPFRQFMSRWEGNACYVFLHAPYKWDYKKEAAYLYRGKHLIGSWNELTNTWWEFDGTDYKKAPIPWKTTP